MKLNKSVSNFQPAPEGTTQGVIVDVVDMGMLPGYKDGDLVHKLRLVFQTEETTEDGVPFQVSTFPMTASEHQQSKLYKEFIKPILGRDLNKDDYTEAEDGSLQLDIDALLIGQNAQVTIEHKTKGDKVYANAMRVTSLTASQKKKLLEPTNYVRMQDREETSTDDSDYGADEQVEDRI